MNADTVVLTLSTGDTLSFSPNSPQLTAAVQTVCNLERQVALSRQDQLATTQQALAVALEQVSVLKDQLCREQAARQQAEECGARVERDHLAAFQQARREREQDARRLSSLVLAVQNLLPKRCSSDMRSAVHGLKQAVDEMQ